MIADGQDVRTVAGRLGYRDASTTLKVYAHVLPERDLEAAESLGRSLAPPVWSLTCFGRHGFVGFRPPQESGFVVKRAEMTSPAWTAQAGFLRRLPPQSLMLRPWRTPLRLSGGSRGQVSEESSVTVLSTAEGRRATT